MSSSQRGHLRYYGRGSQRASFSPRGTAFPSRGRASGYVPPPRDILDGLAPKALQTISRVGETPKGDITITNLQYLASYNWIESEQPTIIVPGSPRKWLNKPLPFQVSPDSGQTFADQNGHRTASSPLLPLFRAVDIMEAERKSPKLDWRSVDIITDRNNMRKLLAWAEGKDDQFRIDIQLGGPWTMLLHRWHEQPVEDARFKGFGDSFERASTAPVKGCEHGTLAGHQRIVSYDFAGLSLVVRFEVDAFDPSKCSPSGEEDFIDAEAALDDLTGALSSMTVGSTTHVTATSDAHGLHVIRAGTEVPQSALVKIKTRSARNVETFEWDNFYPQLSIGQIPTLYIGVHQSGRFYEVRKKRLDAPELKSVAKKAQEGFNKLGQTLNDMHAIVLMHGKEARLSLVCKNGVLQLMERTSEDSYLPTDVLARFEC